MKKILVTGGAGFVGSHLCATLLKSGNKVICVDNFDSGRMCNIEHLLKNENFELIEHDITLPINIVVDEIYNLACPASPPHYQKNPIKTFKISVLGSLNLLELAHKNNSKILQASTSEVYGDPTISIQDEKYWGNVNPIGIRSCYDEGKRGAETLFFDYFRTYKTDIKVIRIFNTYGPNMDPNDGRVVSNFIVQALTNNDITIYGDGKQTRSFQYVDDLVDGIIKMMNTEDFTGPVNIGNPDEFTIIELAKIILQLIPESKSKIIFKDLPQDDPMQRKPDITVAKTKLNWKPDIKLKTGLINTIEYFRNEIKK